MILFRIICLTLIFICHYGYAAAQEREPDFRIDTNITNPVNIQFSPNGDYLLMFGFGKVYRYNLYLRQIDLQFSIPHAFDIIFAINADGTRLVSLYSEMLEITDLDSGELLQKIPNEYGSINTLTDKIAFFSEESIIVMQNNVMSFHEEFYIVDLSSGMWEQIQVQATAIAQSSSKSIAIAKRKYDLSFGYELEKRSFSDVSEAAPPKTIDGTGLVRELVFSGRWE